MLCNTQAATASSQEKACTTETGLNYRQSEAVVSTDLLARAEVIAEFIDADSNQFYKAWKKFELQQGLKHHGLKVSGTKEELVARVGNVKRAGVETVVESAAHENKEITKRAAEKLSTPTETLPDPDNLRSWTKDLSRLPRLTSKDIMNYLVFVSCKFYRNEDMQCFKQLKAYKFAYKLTKMAMFKTSSLRSLTIEAVTVLSGPKYYHQ